MNNLLEIAVQRKIMTLMDFSRCEGWINMEGLLKACHEGTEAVTQLLIDDNGDPGLSFSVACTIHDAWQKSPRLNTILAWFMLDLPYSKEEALHCCNAVDLFIHEGGFQHLHRVLLNTPHYCGLRIFEVERFIDDIVSTDYRHPLEAVPSFAAIRHWYARLMSPGFRVRQIVGPSFSLDTVFALTDVIMNLPNGWTGQLGPYTQLEYEERIMGAWWNWITDKGYADADRPGLGNAIDELYECSPFVW